MNVRVLGCHGSGQLIPGENGPIQCGTCGFLVNDQLLVDAGTIGSRLFLDEQRRIRVVLLTQLHFDHIRELPTLADNLVGEIDEPVVSIETMYKGASAEVVESTITKPLEDSLSGIEGVDVMTSQSRAERSQINVKFKLTRDPDSAAADVRDKVARVRGRPVSYTHLTLPTLSTV